MKEQSVISSDVKPCDGKGWDETCMLEVIFTMEVNNKKKVFKGNIDKVVGINKIE